MNIEQTLTLFDQEQRIDLSFPNIRREATPYVVRHIDLSENEPESWVIYSRLDERNVDAAISEETAYFESIGHNFEWKLYTHDTPSNLKERLSAHGFEVEEVETVMVLDLQEAPSALLKPVRHDVRRITDPDDLGDFAEVMMQIWQDAPANHIEHLAYALTNNPESLSIYVAYQGNVPVSAARISWHANSQFAGLWGGSTVKAYRRQGSYTALLAARLQEALRRNTCYLTIDASPMSRPILEKFGFQVLTYTYPCKRRKT